MHRGCRQAETTAQSKTKVRSAGTSLLSILDEINPLAASFGRWPVLLAGGRRPTSVGIAGVVGVDLQRTFDLFEVDRWQRHHASDAEAGEGQHGIA